MRDVYGEEVEVERPVQIHLEGDVPGLVGRLSQPPLSGLATGRGSPLFNGPVEHFFVRAFLSEAIDEFLAHVTCIEAALGTPVDHDRARSKFGRNQPGATARVGALLADDEAAQAYLDLFEQRSLFLHGRSMGDISSTARKAARRLMRRVVTALIALAASDSATGREVHSERLLQAGIGAVLARAERNGASPPA